MSSKILSEVILIKNKCRSNFQLFNYNKKRTAFVQKAFT